MANNVGMEQIIVFMCDDTSIWSTIFNNVNMADHH